MILISHRGNIAGPNNKENSPEFILEACHAGFQVEIDVWFQNSNFYLGHDYPTYKVELDFLLNPRFWCHAKNISALAEMSKYNIHYFWHQNDDVTLTSHNYFWTYPGKLIADINAIAVCPERTSNWDTSKSIGICSDFISNYL